MTILAKSNRSQPITLRYTDLDRQIRVFFATESELPYDDRGRLIEPGDRDLYNELLAVVLVPHDKNTHAETYSFKDEKIIPGVTDLVIAVQIAVSLPQTGSKRSIIDRIDLLDIVLVPQTSFEQLQDRILGTNPEGRTYPERKPPPGFYGPDALRGYSQLLRQSTRNLVAAETRHTSRNGWLAFRSSEGERVQPERLENFLRSLEATNALHNDRNTRLATVSAMRDIFTGKIVSPETRAFPMSHLMLASGNEKSFER